VIDFKPGDTVSHATFGKGMVVGLTPMANDTLVEVAFEKVGTKKIMANFAKLQKV
jgi:DNA helicase-2/ATP-dependent DNA helicase PcrA